MARTIDEINEQAKGLLVDGCKQIGITINTETWSKTNILRMLCYSFSVIAHVLEENFDLFKADVESYLLNLKPGTALWYANKAKSFRYGVNLTPETDMYNTSGMSDIQIEQSRIVKHAAVTEHTNQFGRLYLRCKVAGESGGDLRPLTSGELGALRMYMSLVKYAGIHLEIESNEPDRIKQSWKIYYNPLILDGAGNRLDGTADDVVKIRIKEYLQSIPFNGIYAPQKHEDYVQGLEGIVLCPIQYTQTAYGLYDWEPVVVKTTPDAGYFRFDQETDLTIDYIPYQDAV